MFSAVVIAGLLTAFGRADILRKLVVVIFLLVGCGRAMAETSESGLDYYTWDNSLWRATLVPVHREVTLALDSWEIIATSNPSFWHQPLSGTAGHEDSYIAYIADDGSHWRATVESSTDPISGCVSWFFRHTSRDGRFSHDDRIINVLGPHGKAVFWVEGHSLMKNGVQREGTCWTPETATIVPAFKGHPF